VVIPQAKVENYSYTPSPEFKGTYEYLLTCFRSGLHEKGDECNEEVEIIPE
jgi:hypothetical protein